MTSPKVRSEPSDIRGKTSRQRLSTEDPVGRRIIEALDGRSIVWLARESGEAENTIRDAIRRGVAKTEVALSISAALERSADWLLTGRTAVAVEPRLTDAADVDWVHLPRYDLAAITETGRGEVLERLPMRRDWLARRVLASRDLWITELLSDYEDLGLAEGDIVICSDLSRGQLPADNTIGLFVAEGTPFVARYTSRHAAGGATVDTDAIVQGVQPIARIHARLLARL